MQSARSLSLPRASLLVLFLLDLVAAIALVMNQWLALEPWRAWTFSALLSAPVAMLLWPFIDRLVSSPVATRDMQFPGDKIPGVGQ
jgi:membrane protein implicated in regulation of membrane protease activity